MSGGDLVRQIGTEAFFRTKQAACWASWATWWHLESGIVPQHVSAETVQRDMFGVMNVVPHTWFELAQGAHPPFPSADSDRICLVHIVERHSVRPKVLRVTVDVHFGRRSKEWRAGRSSDADSRIESLCPAATWSDRFATIPAFNHDVEHAFGRTSCRPNASGQEGCSTAHVPGTDSHGRRYANILADSLALCVSQGRLASCVWLSPSLWLRVFGHMTKASGPVCAHQSRSGRRHQELCQSAVGVSAHWGQIVCL